MLADETPAAAAECGADGEVFLPSGGAGYEKVGDIEAGDEQHAKGGCEQGVERRFEVLNCGIEQRAADGACVDSRIRMRELDMPLNGVNLMDEAGERGTRGEAGDDQELVVLEHVHEGGRFMAGGGPELCLRVEVPGKGRGHDADDGVGRWHRGKRICR